MTFYIQHGYGKGQKLPEVLSTGNLGGVILSPGDEDSGTFGETARYCRQNQVSVLVDPQFYFYSTQPSGSGRNHDSHGLSFGGLSWAQDAQSLANYVNRVGELNSATNPDGLWIAPGPLLESFAGLWTPLSVQLARTASQSWGEERTLATVAIDESALGQWNEIERWLDVATTLPVHGFYILVSRPSTSYPTLPWAPAKLANLLRLIHVLGVLNEFEVVWGFSDFEGLLGLGAGATAMATGWSYTLRQFSSTKWMSPAGGGRAATVRTHLRQLWSVPRAEAEVAPLFESDLQSTVFSEDEIAAYSGADFGSLTRVEMQVDHMNVLAQRARLLSAQPDLGVRAEMISGSLERALCLFDEIDQSGILLEPAYRKRVQSYRDGFSIFTDEI
ncbi:MAG: hypothetical protein ACNYNX_06920 [Leucobacter sp.]